MNLDKYRTEAEKHLTRLEAVEATLAGRGDFTDAGKANVLVRARETYNKAMAELMEQARAELAKEREAQAGKAEQVQAARGERFRQVLGETGAAQVFMRQVEKSDYAERLRLWEDGDEWARAIIAALTPVTSPGDPGEVKAWYPLNVAIAEAQPDDEREVRQAERTFAGIAQEIEELDSVASLEQLEDQLNTDFVRPPVKSLSNFSPEVRRQAGRDVGAYLSAAQEQMAKA